MATLFSQFVSEYQLGADGHRGTSAVQRLVEYAPATGGLALWMQHRDVQSPPASARWVYQSGWSHPWLIGNDGLTIYYGEAFEQLSLSRQTGHVAHQVLHVALQHVSREGALKQRVGDVDGELFGVCADAIVNASLSHLNWLELPPNAVMLDTLVKRVLGVDEALGVSLQRWDTEGLYRAIDDRQFNEGSSESRRGRASASSASADSTSEQGDTTPTTPSDDTEHTEQLRERSASDGPRAAATRQLSEAAYRDLIPDDGALQPHHQEQQAQQWRERLLRASAADGSLSLVRQWLADQQGSRVPWQLWLRTRMQRSLALQSDVNWSRPSRSWIANQGRTRRGKRLPWQPGTTYAQRRSRLCVLVDVSGSVEDALLQRFATEIDRLLRLHGAEALLLIGDDQVREQHQLKPGCQSLRELSITGGGGTDFRPMLRAAADYRPDIAVYLTDLDGPAGDPPAWPVIWAVPRTTDVVEVPFGQRVDLE